MKKITVVSGKGGVGKTSVTAALAYLYAQDKFKVVVTDCDVDAPNLAIIMKNQKVSESDIQSANIAVLNKDECTSCKKCYENCKFKAIKWNDDEQIPIISDFECEGCGVCSLICPAKCIQMIPIKTGTLISSNSVYGIPIVSGELLIGRGNSGKIVAEAKMAALKIAEANNSSVILNDGPPGIGCPVIASLSNSDYIIIITEPTPAAIHDLKRVLTLSWHFTKNIGIIINKYDLNLRSVSEIENLAANEKLEILGKIPLDDAMPHSLVQLVPIIEYSPSSPASKELTSIYKKLNQSLDI